MKDENKSRTIHSINEQMKAKKYGKGNCLPLMNQRTLVHVHALHELAQNWKFFCYRWSFSRQCSHCLVGYVCVQCSVIWGRYLPVFISPYPYLHFPFSTLKPFQCGESVSIFFLRFVIVLLTKQLGIEKNVYVFVQEYRFLMKLE